MKRSLLLVGMVVLLAGASMWSATVQLRYFRVQEEGDTFAITWKADQQEGVEAFVLLHKTPYSGGAYKQIRTVDDPVVGQEYRHVDTELYKAASEQVSYRLEAHFSGGGKEVWDQTVDYQPTAVRRTWGSIKAMFQ